MRSKKRGSRSVGKPTSARRRTLNVSSARAKKKPATAKRPATAKAKQPAKAKRVAKAKPPMKRVAKAKPPVKRVAKAKPPVKRVAKAKPPVKRVAKRQQPVKANRLATGKSPARTAGKTLRAKPALRRAPLVAPARAKLVARPALAAPAPAPAPAPTPVLRVADVAAPAPPLAVRVGRLPPRGDGAQPPEPPRGVPAAEPAPRLTPTAPRPAFEHETWQRVEAVARELELPELTSDQRKAIRAVLEGRDALVSLPPGLARTACFAVPSRLLGQPVLVVGPRPALMRELHDRLLQRRVPVVRFDASLTEVGKRQALERIAKGGALVVLTTAAALHLDELPRALAECGVSLVAVSDAQTATAATDEVSPAALELGRALERLGRPPVLALLGAATPLARHEVVDALGLRSPVHVEAPLVGKNIALDVLEVRGEARQRALVQLVLQLRRPGVIFAPTAREVDSIYGALSALRLPVHRYHTHMPPGDRVGEQLNFMLPGRRSIMVATSAFGSPSGVVGVGEAALLDKAPADFGLCLEKKDLRFVLHWSAPASLEQYLREIALAGRDGDESTCVLFHDGSDRARHEASLAQARIPSRHLTHLAKALEPAAIDARPRTLESLALASGLSRKLTETLAAILDDAGLVDVSQGWLRVTSSAPALSAGAQRLAARLDRLRAQDGRRLGGVSAYAEVSGCRLAALARYFGETGVEACGRCGGCRGSLLPAFADDAGSSIEPAHGRRPAVETFTLGQPESFGIGVGAPARVARPLTVKLSDFQRGR